MNTKKTVLVFFLISASLGIISCSKSSPDKKESNVQSENIIADDALLENADAEKIKEVILSYKGDKAVLVNVWATWCVPCVEEFPEIVKIQGMYLEKLKVVFISADFSDDRERAVKFLKDHKVDWTTYFKDDKDEPFINALSKDWSGALPFSMVIDKNGNEIAHWEKKADFDTFNKHVKQAINP